MKQVVDVEGLPKAGPYSLAVRSGNLLYLSGQTGEGMQFEEQFRNAMNKIGKILAAAGSSYDMVLRVTVYLSERSFFKEMNLIYSEYFTSRHPARTTVVASFPNEKTLVEVDVIAE